METRTRSSLAPGQTSTQYTGPSMWDMVSAPARAMTAMPSQQNMEQLGLMGKIHQAIDPVQAMGGYGNMAAMALPPGAPRAKMPAMTKPYKGSGPFKGKLYHGTNTPFDKVDMEKGSMGTFWVTSDKEAIAKGTSGASGQKHVLEFDVDVKNPAGWKEYDKYSTGELISQGYDSVILPNKDGSFDAILFHPNQAKRLK